MRTDRFSRSGGPMKLLAMTCLLLLPSPTLLAQHQPESIYARLAEAAIERTHSSVTYDGTYRRLSYPGGDVPLNIGVCTDLVVRSFRAVGLDLQQLVHEDMRSAFSAYPRFWSLSRPDPNIDHRRVPNLQVFFTRRGAVLPVSSEAGSFQPGDLVTWRLPSNLPHIGIVSNRRTPDNSRPLIVHNIGSGPELEDMLYAYPITGHYRYPSGD